MNNIPVCDNSKYEFTGTTREVDGHTLYRICALRDFGDVKAGDLGGWIEKEWNLSDYGDGWIADNACVFEDAIVTGDARVDISAKIHGHAHISGHAHVSNSTIIAGYAHIIGEAEVLKTTEHLVIHPFGHWKLPVTFYRQKNGEIGVHYPHFKGSFDDFLHKVTEDNPHFKSYMLATELARVQILGE